jgi:hypothetical protein
MLRYAAAGFPDPAQVFAFAHAIPYWQYGSRLVGHFDAATAESRLLVYINDTPMPCPHGSR